MSRKDLLEWLIPILLGLIAANIQSTTTELREVGKQLAVIVEKVNAHEQRISRLEAVPGHP